MVCFGSNKIKRHIRQKRNPSRDFKQLVRNRKLNRGGQVIRLMSRKKVGEMSSKNRGKNSMITQLEVDYYSLGGRQYVTCSGRVKKSFHPPFQIQNARQGVFFHALKLLCRQCVLIEVRLTGTYNLSFMNVFCLEVLNKLRSCIFDEF